jgi:cell division protein YceG involved in septum cleavage
MVNIYGINLLNFINSYTKDVIIYVLKVFWFKYQCRYGPEEYRENSTHIQSIKRGCLASFSIKRLYTQLDVAKIKIYHKAYTRIDGSFTHGEHDLESISRMFRYAPCMSQALKDHIWAQLSLGYTTKQIYDKHKAIWWERVNAGQNITRDDFIQL